MSDFDANAFLNNEPISASAPTQAPASTSQSSFNANDFLGNEGGGDSGIDQRLADYDKLQGKYGTPGQQAITALEGGAEGVIGSVAPAIEIATGLSTPENIRGRSEANPWAHGLAKAGTFAASAYLGTGLAGAVGKVGEGAAALTGLGEVAGPIAKIAATGIKTGAEMAALQIDDEVSKAITQVPGQSLGSAAINVGLAGILGIGGGSAIGAVSPLWKTAVNKIGAEKIASDFMGETKFLRENPDLAQGAAQEVTSRMAEADQILNGGLKGKAIAETLPEATPENIAKIDSHLMDIANKASSRITDAENNAYLKSVTPRLKQDLDDFLSVITNPDDSVANKWDALDDFKRASQGHADYNVITGGPEEKAISKWMKPFNVELREAAENSKIWGEAGNVQKTVNKATSALYDAQKDFIAKATDKELGERVASPTKLQTLINTSEKGKVGVRQNAVKNYLEATQTAADAINAAHINNGLEAPLESKLNPTPILDRTLNTPVTAGRSLAQWANRKGATSLANAAGESAAGIVGGGIGAILHHPLVGAWAGERILSPVFSVLAKPFAENAINSEAMKSSIDYVANAVRGDKTLINATKAFFKSGELIPEHLLPNEKSRNRLKSQLETMNNDPESAVGVGGNIGHYLPGHASAAGSMAAKAQNYFNSLKPRQPTSAPLDIKPPIDKMAEARYNRALDIAQQPLLVLKHAKDGTLQAQDIRTLNTIYPDLHGQIAQKLSEQMMSHVNSGNPIPYVERRTLSMVLGSALDSTMTPNSAQAIMRSAAIQQASNPSPIQSKNRKASGKELEQINKVNSMLATGTQQREMNKKA